MSVGARGGARVDVSDGLMHTGDDALGPKVVDDRLVP